jgi:glycosyltransferase involved in cell wall biosynthesis
MSVGGARLPRPFAAVAGLLSRAARRLRGGPAGPCFDLEAGAVGRLLARYGLPPLPGSPREVAFRDGRLARGEKVYELREDVREAFPLGLTPAGREGLLDWFLREGRDESGVSVADVLRYLFEQDGRPDRGLVATYRVQPAWQAAHPGALTPDGWEPFKRWVAERYGVRGRWLRNAGMWSGCSVEVPTTSASGGREPPEGGRHHWERPRPSGGSRPPLAGLFDRATGPRTGVNVIGLFRHASGLQRHAVEVVDALQAAGVETSLRDVPTWFQRDDCPRTGFDGLERFPVTIIDTGLDIPVADAYRLAGLHRREGVYRVGMWLWELEQLPSGWHDRGEGVDEIWAPTSFIAAAVRPLGKPVTTIPTPVRLPPFDPLPKAHFGLDPGRFAFLFAFDMNSRLPRKNPLGLIRAFRTAFERSEPVDLVVKVSPQEQFYPEWWRELRAAAADAGVKLIDRSLPREEVFALMNAADAYVSLHRSEGVGLTMAEAMLLGKPTIATAYSGNLDFMTNDNSYLVSYDRVTIAEDVPPYPKGLVWAEPSVGHAAELMRRVVDRPDEARAVAARGRLDAARLFASEAAGRRMAARLEEIARRA